MPKKLRGWLLLNADIQDVLDKQTEAWGIKVSNVEIKLIDLDESKIRAIASQAEAERTRRAKIINAEGRAAGGRRSCSKPPESWRWGILFENFRSRSKPENLHASNFRQLRSQSMRNFYDEYDLYDNGDEPDSFGFADPGGKLLCAQPAKIGATYHAQLVMSQIGSRQRTAQTGVNANHALMLAIGDINMKATLRGKYWFVGLCHMWTSDNRGWRLIGR